MEKRLTAKQKEIFNEYSDLRTEEECWMGQADSLHGFRMGVKLMAEVFCEKQDQ